MPPRSRPRRRALLTVLALALVWPNLLGLDAAATQSTADRTSRFDGRLSKTECEVMGRVFDPRKGCSRTACRGPAVLAKRVVNAEMCQLRGQGDFAYGAAIDFRQCRALHRRWVAPVNWCAANPDRGRGLVERAPQCVGPYSTYLNHQETEGYHDECLKPAEVRRLRRIADDSRVSLERAASVRSEALCAGRPQHEFRDGRCVDVGGPTGPQGGVLVLGDSITYRGTDELAPLAPELVLDGYPGRRFTDLVDRLRRFKAARGHPDGLVVELGTNPAPRFARSDLRGVLDSLPAQTPLLLVLPIRFAPGTDALSHHTRRYVRWMRAIARGRDATCVADWVSQVRRRPGLLVDGVHLTPSGEAYWARWLLREWRHCAAALETT